MSTKATRCKLCEKIISSNGKLRVRGEIYSHLLNYHPLEYQQYVKDKEQIMKQILAERLKILDLTRKLVDNPELLLLSKEIYYG